MSVYVAYRTEIQPGHDGALDGRRDALHAALDRVLEEGNVAFPSRGPGGRLRRCEAIRSKERLTGSTYVHPKLRTWDGYAERAHELD
jgi:hypothetical protein